MRSPLRSLLLAVLITIGASVSAILIAWIVLSTVGDAIRWSEFSRRFEIGLTIGRALLYSALLRAGGRTGSDNNTLPGADCSIAPA